MGKRSHRVCGDNRAHASATTLGIIPVSKSGYTIAYDVGVTAAASTVASVLWQSTSNGFHHWRQGREVIRLYHLGP